MEHMIIIRGRFSGRQIALAYTRPIHLGTFNGRNHGRAVALRVALTIVSATLAGFAAVALYGFVSAALASLS